MPAYSSSMLLCGLSLLSISLVPEGHQDIVMAIALFGEDLGDIVIALYIVSGNYHGITLLGKDDVSIVTNRRAMTACPIDLLCRQDVHHLLLRDSLHPLRRDLPH